jgi:ferric-dicitrate binding protein FerR (iron transport regulator)
MRDDDELTAAERRLGRMLRSNQDRVNDVINRALLPQRTMRARGRARLLVAAFIALIVLGAFVWRAPAPPPAALTISGSGSVIVVTTEDGRRWVVDERNESRPRGQYAIAIPQ